MPGAKHFLFFDSFLYKNCKILKKGAKNTSSQSGELLFFRSFFRNLQARYARFSKPLCKFAKIRLRFFCEKSRKKSRGKRECFRSLRSLFPATLVLFSAFAHFASQNAACTSCTRFTAVLFLLFKKGENCAEPQRLGYRELGVLRGWRWIFGKFMRCSVSATLCHQGALTTPPQNLQNCNE